MSEPEAIADEYLRTGDSRQQKNALTLLRVLAGGNGAARLAKEAVENDDPLLRQYATEELRNLAGEGSPGAVNAARHVFETSTDERRRVRAYLLLGELGAPAGTGSLWEGLRIARNLHLAVYPRKDLAFYFRSVLPSLLGTALVALVLLLELSSVNLLSDKADGDAGMILLYAMVAALIVPPLLTLRSVPFAHYSHFLSGAIVESMTPALLVILLFLLCSLVYAVVMQGIDWGTVPYAAGVLITSVIAVRLGTVLAHGATRVRQTSFAMAAVAGGVAGMCALTLLLLLRPEHSLAAHWVSLGAVTFGLASAFAFIDSHARARSTRPGRTLAQVWGAAAIVTLAFLLGFPVYQTLQTTMPLAPETRRLSIDGAPQVVRFSLDRRSEVSVELTSTAAKPTEEESGDTLLTLRGANNNEIATDESDLSSPMRLVATLEPGRYTLGIDQYSAEGDLVQNTILSSLFGRQGADERNVFEAALTAMHINREIYTAVRKERTDIGRQTFEVKQSPFVMAVNAPSDAGGIRVALPAVTADEDAEYHIGLYKGNEEIIEPDTAPVHQSFEPSDDGSYLVVVRKRDSDFVPRPQNGQVIADTVPLPTPLTLDLEVYSDPVETNFEPTGTFVTSVAPSQSIPPIPVTRLPFVHFLDVTGPRRSMTISLQQPQDYHDVVLALYDPSGKQIAQEDDPEEISAEFSPGRYWLVVRPYEDRRQTLRLTNGSIVLPAISAPSSVVLTIR